MVFHASYRREVYWGARARLQCGPTASFIDLFSSCFPQSALWEEHNAVYAQQGFLPRSA
jgi:hypothetical protein